MKEKFRQLTDEEIENQFQNMTAEELAEYDERLMEGNLIDRKNAGEYEDYLMDVKGGVRAWRASFD